MFTNDSGCAWIENKKFWCVAWWDEWTGGRPRPKTGRKETDTADEIARVNRCVF